MRPEAASRRDPTRAVRTPLAGDDGSTIPLILGFWLLAVLFIAGAVALGDAFLKQRDLQSICDGAAVTAANSADSEAIHGRGLGSAAAIPLASVTETVQAYLNRSENDGVAAVAAIDNDGVTVRVTCRRHVHVAFGAIIGRPGGIDQVVDADARSPLRGA